MIFLKIILIIQIVITLKLLESIINIFDKQVFEVTISNYCRIKQVYFQIAYQ